MTTDKPQWRLPTDDMPDGWYWCEGYHGPVRIVRDVGGILYERVRDGSLWRLGPMTRIAPCTGRPE
jgi:hypothetical protein